ncbi:MAG: universal stress protein [Chloroflexota bacterium]
MNDSSDVREAAGLRVVLAVDGSEGSDIAVELAAGLDWPPDSILRVVTAIEPDPQRQSLGPWWTYIRGTHIGEALHEELEALVSRAATRLEPTGCEVERDVLIGRPADAVISDADAFGADLAIVGNRGHGPVQSALLGSFSAELVDRAACPVLVARRRSVRQVLAAYDGSPAASRAIQLASEWGLFGSRPVTVVSVAKPPILWHAGIAPAIYQEVIVDYGHTLASLEAEHSELASQAAQRLQSSVGEVRAMVRTGDPAAQILALADADEIDLVIMGSRGHTGLSRALLGSVARHVLQHASCSVLVVSTPEAV